jgi:hypothetical protein
MRNFILVSATLVIGATAPIQRIPHSDAVIAEQERPDLAASFNGNYQQYVDHLGNAARAAFDASGKRIGTQVGHVGGPSGIVVEMTYLEPDAEHPRGQAFDGAGKPMPLH